MSEIMEAVLKLPRKDKIEVMHAIQENLEAEDNISDDEIFAEDELSPEDWAELKRREAEIERGENIMTYDEFREKLNALHK